MQVSVEAGEGLMREVRVELAPEAFQDAFDKRLSNYARSARLPGFRPGKVPAKILRQHYGEHLRDEVLSEMVKSTLPQALSEADLLPAGMPDIEYDVDLATGRYGYRAKFEVLPTINLNGIAGHSIIRPVTEIRDEDLDRMVERLRENRRVWTPVERAAMIGDQVTVCFKGSIDNQPFAGGVAEDFPIELGSGRMVPGFEDQLVGAVAGDERSFDLTFPDNYHGQHLAGKTAHFDLTVKRIAAAALPELGADFFAALGVENSDLDAFRADVRANMEREVEKRIMERIKKQVFDALIEMNPIDVPQALILSEAREMRRHFARSLGMEENKFRGLGDEHFLNDARRRTALGLLLAEAAKRFDLNVTDEEIRARIETMAATYEKPQEFIVYHMASADRRQLIKGELIEERVVARLLEDANIEEQPVSFGELTQTADSDKVTAN